MNRKNIKIEIDKNTAQGEYANLVLTAHSQSEFIFDFAKFLPGIEEAKVHTRIIMTPSHAKAFLNSLSSTIEKYENDIGKITPDEKNANIGFKKE